MHSRIVCLGTTTYVQTYKRTKTISTCICHMQRWQRLQLLSSRVLMSTHAGLENGIQKSIDSCRLTMSAILSYTLNAKSSTIALMET